MLTPLMSVKTLAVFRLKKQTKNIVSFVMKCLHGAQEHTITSVGLDTETNEITVSWEANNNTDFLNYKLYKSEFEWSYDTKQLIYTSTDQYDNSYTQCISYDSNSQENCIYINLEYLYLTSPSFL